MSFSQKKPLQKRETVEFLILCAKKVDPLFVVIQLVKKEGKRCLCLFTLKNKNRHKTHA